MNNDYQEEYYYSDFIYLSDAQNRELEEWLRKYFKGETGENHE